jgi:hypothetical protein
MNDAAKNNFDIIKKMDKFKLPIHVIYNCDISNTKKFVGVSTTGLLSSMGGALHICNILGRDNVNVGCWLTPIKFKCSIEELEIVKQLLEETLQIPEPLFDRDKSSLVVFSVKDNINDVNIYI